MDRLTEKHLRTLRHMLGINCPWMAKPVPTRDYYCAPKGHVTSAELLRLGMVRMYRCDTYEWYTTTDAGRAAAIASFRSIQHPKAKRRYMKWLEISDCLPDVTFREFLMDPRFAETRRSV